MKKSNENTWKNNSNITKWTTIVEYIDIETGEIINDKEIKQTFIIGHTTKTININGNNAQRKLTHYGTRTKQQRLF